MARTDIHRPSSVDFDPENYDLVNVFDLRPIVRRGYPTPEEQRIGYWVDVLSKQGWSVDNIEGEDGNRASVGGQCGHCGAYIRYAAMLTHKVSKTLITVGEDCLNNRFNGEITKQKFQQLRKEGALNAKRRRIKELVQKLIVEHPELEILTKLGESDVTFSHFVHDVASRLIKKGELSDKQIDAVKKAIVREQDYDNKRKVWEREREDRQAKWKRETELADPAPTGRITVEGEIIYHKAGGRVHMGDYIDWENPKMIIKTKGGWKVWSTVPRNIWDEVEKGKQIVINLTVTPSDDDPKFAWGKRPAKAIVS